MKRDHSPQVAEIQVGQSEAVNAGTKRTPLGARFARVATLTAFVALGVGLFSGCSDALECKPPVPEGAVYKVTIMNETPNSDECHLVNALLMSPFSLTVQKTEPTAARPDCSVTPASAPTEQLDVLSSELSINRCSGNENSMLGQYCEITYSSGCQGHMQYYFLPAAGAAVNWSDSVIGNVLFRVEDFPGTCFSNHSKCVDEYSAKLERMQ
jgi:hypothetical protein